MNEYFEGIDSIKFEVVKTGGRFEPPEEYKRCFIEKGGIYGNWRRKKQPSFIPFRPGGPFKPN